MKQVYKKLLDERDALLVEMKKKDAMINRSGEPLDRQDNQIQ